MEALVFLVILLAIIGGSDAVWCVCRADVATSAQQKSLDYACGAGADCSPIIQNGACYNPNTVIAHCSYACNSYFQKKGQAQGACDFSGTAIVTSTDPSGNGCTYPATPSSAGTITTSPTTATPSTATPSNTNPGSTTPTTFPGSTTPTTYPGSTTPSTFQPNTGTGVYGGLGPSGNSISTDNSGGITSKTKIGSPLLTILFSFMVFMRG